MSLVKQAGRLAGAAHDIRGHAFTPGKDEGEEKEADGAAA